MTKEGFLDNMNSQIFIKHNSSLINLIKQHDAIIFNGEGTLHGLNQAPVSLLYVAYIAKKIFNKHVEILNHSAYPQHNTLIGNTQEAAIYKLVYDNIDFASIREPVSFNTMKKLNIKAVESFDCMPLYIRDNYIKSNIKHSKELLIAGSATWLQLNIPSNQKGNIEDFTQGLLGFNKYLRKMSSKGFKIKFLSGAKGYPSKDDKEFIEYMQKQFQINWEVYEAASLNDWLRTIEESTMLVSGRFHHTIAAASLRTPFLMLNSNTPKMKGLAKVLSYGKIIKYDDHEIYDKLMKQTDKELSSSKKETYFQDSSLLNKLCAKSEVNFECLRKLAY